MFEAGTFPAMWAHLTRFYAGGTHLAAAWGFIGAAQPFAQVLPLRPCTLALHPLIAARHPLCAAPLQPSLLTAMNHRFCALP